MAAALPSLYNLGAGYQVNTAGRGMNNVVAAPEASNRQAAVAISQAAQQQARGSQSQSRNSQVDPAAIVEDTERLPRLDMPDMEKITSLNTMDPRLAAYLRVNAEGKNEFDLARMSDEYTPAFVQSLIDQEAAKKAQLVEYLQPYKDIGLVESNESFANLWNSTVKGQENIAVFQQNYGTFHEGYQGARQQAAENEDVASGVQIAGSFFKTPIVSLTMGRGLVADDVEHGEKRGEEIAQFHTFNDQQNVFGEVIEQTHRGASNISQEAMKAIDPIGGWLGDFVMGDTETPAERNARLVGATHDRYWEYMQTPEGKANPTQQGFQTWMTTGAYGRQAALDQIGINFSRDLSSDNFDPSRYSGTLERQSALLNPDSEQQAIVGYVPDEADIQANLPGGPEAFILQQLFGLAGEYIARPPAEEEEDPNSLYADSNNAMLASIFSSDGGA